MKILKPLLLCLGIALFSTSCEKAEIVNDIEDYFVVGSSHSSVAGYVNPTFLYKKTGAFRSNKYLKTRDLNSHNIKLSDEKWAALQQLFDDLPQELKNYPVPEHTFGCPGCADQPGYFVKFRIDGKVREYFIDTNISALPEFLRGYAGKLGQVLPGLY